MLGPWYKIFRTEVSLEISLDIVPYSTKLSRDKTFVVRSPCIKYVRKAFAFASKQCLLALKHFEIHGKTFVV